MHCTINHAKESVSAPSSYQGELIVGGGVAIVKCVMAPRMRSPSTYTTHNLHVYSRPSNGTSGGGAAGGMTKLSL